jgi:reactive intermediate/imine deaminase
MSQRQQIDPGWKWDDNYSMSQGIRIGNAIYTSGQVALDSDGNVVGEGDMAAQARRALENVKSVLESAGASMADVVKVTVYVTDISRLAETHSVRSDFFPDPPPASTGVEVSALAFPGLLVEIEAVAVKD